MFKWDPILIANRPTLYFVYGLSFFLLGFAIIVQQRRLSRLTLAQALPWLAMFALVHGLAEWGFLFIPLNEPFLSAEAVQGLIVLQIIMWILSFFFLICFGIVLFGKSRQPKFIFCHFGMLVSVLLFATWFFDHSTSYWLTGNDLEILARYVLCIPGAVLAAIGLYRQRGELSNLGSPNLLRYLEMAAISFVGYAVAGGLVVPEASFFPANVINSVNFRNVFNLPIEILRAGLGAMMAFSILKVLRMFDLEERNRVSEINRREDLAKERERISRDLHDGVIQSLYGVGLTLQKLKKTGSQETEWLRQMNYILKSLDEVVTDIRRYIQNLLPHPEDNKILGMMTCAEDALSLPVEFKADGKTLSRLTPFAAEQINLIIREALTNISKHAEATKATVHFIAEPEGLKVQVNDDGKGIKKARNTPDETNGKFGIKNIRARAVSLNGTGEVHFTKTGTRVEVWIPWEGNIIE